MVGKEKIVESYKTLQSEIIDALEQCDGGVEFQTDTWDRPGGGGGISRVARHGNVIEKGGVNFSEVHGKTPQNILDALKLPESDFFATGVSIVLHPNNPEVPIIHMNVRYFEMTSGHWWFGGGIDLTPHYVNKEDARTFHAALKTTCDKTDLSYYPRFKTWADDYFYIKHREETRGVGGIFFDRLTGDRDVLHKFTLDVGQTFAPIYTELMDKYRDAPFGDKEQAWQRIRRGRYVEFNLVWDRGTKFGLDTQGRTESILMSLPPMAGWEYNYIPQAGTREDETLKLLKKDINWLEV